jgi:hypothetical protein
MAANLRIEQRELEVLADRRVRTKKPRFRGFPVAGAGFEPATSGL